MTVNPMAIKIRAKKVGVLLQYARQTAGKSLKDCAQIIGVPEQTLEAYEFGEESPSLPELEILANYLDVPIEHFWDEKLLAFEKPYGKEEENYNRLIPIRQRIIAATLQKKRSEAALSVADLAELSGVASEQLEGYEFGESAIPLPELEILSAAINLPIQDLQDKEGPIGIKMVQRREFQEFIELPEDLRGFVIKPINRPYLELAQRLSEMSVEKLRTVAEGLLEITL